MFGDCTQCLCREERQGGYDEDHGKGHHTEGSGIGAQRACTLRHITLLGQQTCYGYLSD